MADGKGSEEEGAQRKTSEVDTEEECCDSVYRWQQKSLSKMQLYKNMCTDKGKKGVGLNAKSLNICLLWSLNPFL